MKRSDTRILTTHAGSLPRPADLIEMHSTGASATTIDARLRQAVGEVVNAQVDAGVDVVNDGEFGKPSRSAVDYGAWWSYVYDRIEGFEIQPLPEGSGNPLQAGSRDRAVFRKFYEEDGGMGATGGRASAANHGTRRPASARS